MPKSNNTTLAMLASLTLSWTIFASACSGSGSSTSSSGSSTSATATAASGAIATTSQAAQSPIDSAPYSVSVPDSINPISPNTIPIGDGQVTTTMPQVGYVYVCHTASKPGGRSLSQLPWVNTTTNTWDSQSKIHVEGDVSWPTAKFTVTLTGTQRILYTNDLPMGHGTGVFPIQPSDPAYTYDTNPNSILSQNITASVPQMPEIAARPTCLPMGPIGVLADGVVLFNALDADDRDGVVHEVLDAACDGHPQSKGIYHHHDVPSCLMSKAGGADTSTLIGYAFDGFGIYIEKDRNGNLLTNANLDSCHGRTSTVMWDGKPTMMYHYDATLEYPYTVGCFMGTPSTPTL